MGAAPDRAYTPALLTAGEPAPGRSGVTRPTMLVVGTAPKERLSIEASVQSPSRYTLPGGTVKCVSRPIFQWSSQLNSS